MTEPEQPTGAPRIFVPVPPSREATLVILDSGHGGQWAYDHIKQRPVNDAHGRRKNNYDPGTMVAGIPEATINDAMTARLALALYYRGFPVKLTRQINWSGNALLNDLSNTDQQYLEALNQAPNTPQMLPDRYNARIETGRNAPRELAARTGRPVHAVYLSIHAEPGNGKQEGVDLWLHGTLPAGSPSHHLAQTLQQSFAEGDALTQRPSTLRYDGPTMQSLLDRYGNPEQGILIGYKQPLAPYPSPGVKEPGASKVVNGLGPDYPAVLIEFGKLANERDAARLTNPADAMRLAALAATGVARFAEGYGRELAPYGAYELPPQPKSPSGRGR